MFVTEKYICENTQFQICQFTRNHKLRLLLDTDLWLSGKESACKAGGPGSIPGSEDPLEKGTAIHSSVLAWRITWTGAWQATIHGSRKELDPTD